MDGSTLQALGGVAAMTWAITFGVDKAFSKWHPPQNLIAIVVGMLLTFANWRLEVIPVDVPRDNGWSWVLVAGYGLFAVFAANKAHDIGSNWKSMVKRTKRGEIIE